MTEPRIQYAKTSDGVSIAFWTLGEGTPLVAIWPTAFSNIQAEWQSPEWRRWYEGLAEKRRLVRYDPRGTGLSDREAGDISLDAQLLDLGAVVDRLAVQRVALFAVNTGAAVAVTYAALHPERVSHIIFWGSVARNSDFTQSPRMQALYALMDSDWELFTETISAVLFGFSEGDQARQFAAVMRESATPESVLAAQRQTEGIDVTDVLGQVKSPALVLHRRGQTIPDVSAARTLATGIPDARLTVLQGSGGAPWQGDMEAVLQTFDEFLGDSEEAEAKAEPLAADDVHTILFTDVEGSTALTDRLGDAKARDLLREHERITREALKEHGGSEVKTMGDGFMASFSSATKALECAIAMQRAFAELNESADETIKVRIGLNAGEPIAEDDPSGRGDLFGTAVNMAARIASKAEGGEILASNVVRELVAGKGFLFADRGDTELRGFEDPVRVYEVRRGEDED